MDGQIPDGFHSFHFPIKIVNQHFRYKWFGWCVCGSIAFQTFGLADVASAQELSVVVPALYQSGSRPNSRPAHFNWEFESSGGGDVRMGQFACGSYWVAPADGDAGVKLLSLEGNPAWNDLLSCDADPITESHGLLDGSNGYGSYNAAQNIIPSLPLAFTPGVGSCISLVAAMQRNEDETSGGGTKSIVGEVVDAYCVVTVLPNVPANAGADMIRPNITGSTKEFLTWDDLDLSRLPTYGFINGKSAQEWENAAIRWRHSCEVFGFRAETSPGNWDTFSEGGRAFRSHLLLHDYASGATRSFNDDVLALLSDQGSLETRKPAIAAMLAYGLDMYHTRYDYGSNAPKAWSSGAGQWSGQFVPPVLLAALQKDETKAHQLRKVAIDTHGQDEGDQGPQELKQTTRGVTGVLLWGDRTPLFRDGNNLEDADWRYWSDFKNSSCYDSAVGDCNPNTGKKTSADLYGYIDGPANKPGTLYMQVAFGSVRALAAIMVLIPEVRSVVNTDRPIEYADRLMRHGIWTYPDPVAPIPVVDQINSCSTWYKPGECTQWGITWGPDPADVRFAIENGEGRFHSLNGSTFELTTGYDCKQARDNWSEIMALYDGLTYEDYATDLSVVVGPEIYFETGGAPRVHLHCATLDAEIRYTLDGTDPDAGSALYTEPVSVANGTEVRAKAFHSERVSSVVRAAVFEDRSSDGTRTWGNGTVRGDGTVDTGMGLRWLYLTEGSWAWSYSLQKWIYAPDPGPDPGGAWIYFAR